MTPLERMIDAYVQEANQWAVFLQDGKGVIARWHRTDDVGGMETKVIETHDDPTHASARFGLMKKNAAMRAALLALARADLPDDVFTRASGEMTSDDFDRIGPGEAEAVFRAMCRAIAESGR